MARVDPNLPAVKGVTTDAAGNLYISDSQVGVVRSRIHQEPRKPLRRSWSPACLPAGQVVLDSARNLMYVPTSQSQPNGQADVAKVGFGYAEFGSSAVGKTLPAGQMLSLALTAPPRPQASLLPKTAWQKPDFAITGGTCTTAAQRYCGRQELSRERIVYSYFRGKHLRQAADAEVCAEQSKHRYHRTMR